MAERSAKASWKGTLLEGEGTMALGSGAFEGKFSFGSRMGEEPGTNPEELIGAALAGCYTMALNATLGKEGFTVNGSIRPPRSISARTTMVLLSGRSIFIRKRISMESMTTRFQEIAAKVKKVCPVSKALTGTEIVLEAKLVS